MEVYIEQQVPDSCVTLKVSGEETEEERRGCRGTGVKLDQLGLLLLCGS